MPKGGIKIDSGFHLGLLDSDYIDLMEKARLGPISFDCYHANERVRHGLYRTRQRARARGDHSFDEHTFRNYTITSLLIETRGKRTKHIRFSVLSLRRDGPRIIYYPK